MAFLIPWSSRDLLQASPEFDRVRFLAVRHDRRSIAIGPTGRISTHAQVQDTTFSIDGSAPPQPAKFV